MEFNFIEILLLFIGVYLFYSVGKIDSRINKIDNNIKGIKYTLDQISKQVDVPENPINNELRQLLHAGDDIKAIKRVREALGLSLLEAKQYVDSLKAEGI
ncbi:MAG: hypothetical protein LBI82_10895 [Dysgonamonadaceae bacterium]|jgi:ribosomal protein L7/L12|nr:hypothetical protein [Dysgonamonadaceae bacterium]